MPIFAIETNVPKEKVPADFLKTSSALLAKALGKPESYCLVHLKAGQENMSFAGTTDPCGYAQVTSINQSEPALHQSVSAVLFKHLQEKLGIPPDRLYIQFIAPKPADVGWNGATFEGKL